MKTKKTIVIVVVLALVLVVGGIYALNRKDDSKEPKECHPNGQTMIGTCLPEGSCVGPTDGIVPCKDQ